MRPITPIVHVTHDMQPVYHQARDGFADSNNKIVGYAVEIMDSKITLI